MSSAVAITATSGSKQLISSAMEAIEALVSFYAGMAHYLMKGSYVPEHIPLLASDTRARVHVYSLALIFELWDHPHYRNGSFQEDMIKNLRNVAIPGTGIPLSLFCYSKITAMLFVLVLMPLICLVAGINKAVTHFMQTYRERKFEGLVNTLAHVASETLKHFAEQLLHPPDWFSYWRLNCRLASLHSLKTQTSGYRMEDKWTFLVEGEERGVPVTPYLKCGAIVVKDTNEEGGMGIHFFKNAYNGGQWIIQEKIDNSDEIKKLLPENPPLSTVRVITTSTWSLQHKELPSSEKEYDPADYVRAASAVFRAGRRNAKTDHSSVLFDVDKSTGTILRGTTNAHWYQLGLRNIFTTPWLSSHNLTEHPDAPGRPLTGQSLPDVPAMLKLVVDSHFKMLPDVPIVGWDVAYTDKGIMFLEVNLSCNFFRGSFDVGEYFEFVDRYFRHLHDMPIPSDIASRRMHQA